LKRKHTILLVEDEKESAEVLSNYLELHDFQVLLAHEGNRALELIDREADEIHLAVLDIMVPNVDGKEICKKIRMHPVMKDIPVIFLTAKDQEKDEIEGLELGGDDYIGKPASLDLIKTHIETLLRRRSPREAHWLQYGNVYLDTIGKELYVNEEKVPLTFTEYRLIELLFKSPKQVFSRQQILKHISEEDQYVFDRTVDVHIKNLRLKMGEAGNIIKTFRGIGYGVNRKMLRDRY
jgi:two-component system phosphate regulon response regulator PhoB